MSTIVKAIPLILLAGVVFSILPGCTTLGFKSIPLKELEKKYGDATSQFIKIGDVNLFYRDQGSGPVLLLLHGVCASSLTWDGWVRELKDHYRIIRMDLPGFGLTGPVPDAMYDKKEIITLVDDFLTALNVDRAYIAGNSLGGYIAWNYALAHPEKVEKLILVDPLSYNMKMPWILKFASNPMVKPIAGRMMPKFLIDSSVNQVYGDKSKVTDKVKDIYFDMAMREGNKRSYAAVFGILREKNKTEIISTEIPQIKPPTLVMWGTKDEWIPFALLDRWKKDLPTASYIAYEGAGHVPMEEIPEITARDAHEFLSAD